MNGGSDQHQTVAGERVARLSRATVVSNDPVCREHRRLVLELEPMPQARPGQFLHLGPLSSDELPAGRPFLRRAFSIGGLHSGRECDTVDVLYRVVGFGTQWLASLAKGQWVSSLGPLGNGFELASDKSVAWLVAGGVGLPPLLWWAKRLHEANKQTVAFCGARSGDLLALNIRDPSSLDAHAIRPALAADEFSRNAAPLIVSTDDGSLGFRGTVGAALSAYHASWHGDDRNVVVYCCGPERMMRAVAEWSRERRIDCQLCMEREMACGTGTCQSCVVPVLDAAAEEGWRYALCCSEGPVFDACAVIWR
jgi:dihydroorotate dehydrogenase electron transfer subunit